MLTFLISVNCLTIPKAQPLTGKLLFIDEAPIKIDGGCSFFVDNTVPLSENRHQLIIDATHIAFIEFAKGRFAFFKRIQRKATNDGYVEYYKGTEANTKWYGGKVGSFILKINSVTRSEDGGTVRSGLLQLNYPGLSQTLRVHGKSDERDSYYRPPDMR
ncbi:hypothetical protein [Mucilaginibacter agri]|uniref:Uncharacterized protein n=1 Tax=Mucilaginibacter agri TaxID=2695265 RepID=A0A965ZL19_9SPHI|nr:hypothetical protein [Mucilaginibacter agri]NCD71612.1 hypothetical protein [Mucilaginibacter agri]